MKMLPSLIVLAAYAAVGMCASLVQVSNFGTNPTKINMYIYVPDKVAAKPAVIVALHPCGGSATSWFRGTKIAPYADKGGFILIYAGTPNMQNCWDVQSPDSLTHGQGGDALGIISMVKYTLNKYNGDATKVYVMGSSSGAMMTNVMAGSYPDVFEAAAAYSGVAHACFAGAPSATPSSANQTCSRGLMHTPEQWGDFVRNSYPGYTGRRPRMMIVHGLADTVVNPQCGKEALKQWSNVLGVSLTKTASGIPSASYSMETYGDGTKLQGFFGTGVGHTAPVNEDLMLKFFGLIT